MAKRGGFHRIGKHSYPLAGLLRSSSGRAIIGAGGTSATGRTYWYYRDMETGEHWPQDELEGAVYEAVAGALSEPGVATSLPTSCSAPRTTRWRRRWTRGRSSARGSRP